MNVYFSKINYTDISYQIYQLGFSINYTFSLKPVEDFKF